MRAHLRTGSALLVLWAASLALSYVDLGAAALAIALAIAGLKAGLVGAAFMDLARARTAVRLAAITAGALAAVLLALVLGDVALRSV